MAMKYEYFKKVVSKQCTDIGLECNMEGDGLNTKGIDLASTGARKTTSGFISGFINSKTHFVLTGNRDIVDKTYTDNNVRESRNNLTTNGSVTNVEGENVGSKGDIERKWVHSDEITKKLGCDGDVAKCFGTTGYFLSSSGAKGDVLKPLDEDVLKSFESKKNSLLKSRSKDGNGISSESRKLSSPLKNNEKCCTTLEKSKHVTEQILSRFSGTEGDLNDFFNSLVNKCQGNLCKSVVESNFKTSGLNVTSEKKDIIKTEVGFNKGNVDNGLEGKISYDIMHSENCRREFISPVEKTMQDVLIKNKYQDKDHDIETEERERLDLYVFEVERRLAWKQSLKEANINVTSLRPDYSYFTKLDSSLKKNTGFVRKLKNFTSNQLESLLKDLPILNLSKYLSEAASAIVQAKLKISDVTSAVELCNTIHHLYAEFSSHLLQSFQRHLSSKDEDPMIYYRKLNVDLKFFTELMNVGIVNHEESFPLISTVLTIALNMDKEEHNNINVILSFYRHCKEGYAVPRKMRNLAEKYLVKLPTCNLLSETEAHNIQSVLKDYFISLVDRVTKVHQEVMAFEYQNKKILQSKGELNAERKSKWEVLNLMNERLLCGLRSLAIELHEEIPNLPDSNCENNGLHTNDTVCGLEEGTTAALWEDEEELRFYEVLTDLTEFIPTTHKDQLVQSIVQESEDVLDTEAEESDEGSISEDKSEETDETDETETGSNLTNKSGMGTFVNLLPYCMNCDTVNKLAVEFLISLNNKCNRRKLVKSLLGVSRTRLDLLPFYARFVATLNPFIPDISVELVHHLKHEFKYHVRKKDQINIESKIKVVKFIGELVKFRMYTRIEASQCLKLLLHDFSHHHIEMCCTFLESCGRFLFRHSDSHQVTKVCLEQMMRKKSVTALDSRYVTMIENAFYYVDPPDLVSIEKKEQPPMHEFIQKILYQDLSKNNIESILELMYKVDWENSELMEFCIQCLIMAHYVKYNNICYLASIVSGLTCDEDFVGVLVVDGVMEDIRLGMEINLPKYNQRRLAMVKYIGELYKYRVADSTDIFKVLYSLISFGITLTYSNVSVLDPPDNLFRIRLVCVLLETCGQYFNSGTSIKKLDCYLIYFQRYFWFKHEDKHWSITENSFPVGIQYLFQDTLVNLCPNAPIFTSFEEANQAVYEMQKSIASKLTDTVSWLHSSDDEILSAVHSNLGTIAEEDSETSIQLKEHGMSSSIKQIFNPQEDAILTSTDSSEDKNFVSAFNKMVTENIQNRKLESMRSQYVDIPVPMHLRRCTKKTYEHLQHTNMKDDSTVNFVLLIKKGHKQNYKYLNVPFDSELAMKLRTGEEAERAEKQHVKQITLDMNQRLEEENYQDMVTQSQNSVLSNLNRDRKYKYHHPKGAPDADLIFGSKKIR